MVWPHPRPSQNGNRAGPFLSCGNGSLHEWRALRKSTFASKNVLPRSIRKAASPKEEVDCKEQRVKRSSKILLQHVSRWTCWKYPGDVNVALNRTVASTMGGKPCWFTNLWRHCGEPPTSIVFASADVRTSENLAAKVGGANKKTRENTWSWCFPAKKKQANRSWGLRLCVNSWEHIPCQKDENLEFWEGTLQPSRCRKTPRPGSIQANSKKWMYIPLLAIIYWF